jgi:hypothetical protein
MKYAFEATAMRQKSLICIGFFSLSSSVTIYPNAIGHNRIHRQLYYRGIENTIAIMDDDLQIRAHLNTVGTQLLHGDIRDEMKLQKEIDETEYKN